MNVEPAKKSVQPSPVWGPMSLPLSNIALFANVEPEAIEGLLEACPRRELAAGEALIRLGETNRTLYLILDGRLRVHLDSPDQPPLTVLGDGESVGELSVIDYKPASAWVVADTAATLLAVDQERFWSLVHASHAVACNLLGILAQRLRQSDAAINEGQRLQRLYKRHATTDELTGLYNRRWMQNLLRRHLLRCSMNRQPLSLMLVDIDGLRDFNAEFGRAAGDHALFAVAQTLLHSVRPGDSVARYSGGHFLVLLPGTDVVGARIAAERARQAVADAVIMMSDESILPSVTVSIGLTQMQPFDTPEALLAATGIALERAKTSGRNCLSELSR